MSDTMNSDPRKLRKPIRGDIYKDSRNGTFKAVVYGDQFTVIMRTGQKTRSGDNYIHTYISREQFDARQDAGRFEYKPDADPDIPLGDPPYQDNQNEGDQRTLTQTNHQSEQANEEKEDDESLEKIEWSKVDLIGNKIEEEMHKRGYQTESDVDKATVKDLKEVPGVGDGAAENLKQSI